MSHINIIQLMPDKNEDRIGESVLYEDPYFHTRCDYGGDEKEYDKAVDSIAKQLEPVATVDKKERTITFKPKDTVLEHLIANARKTFDEFERTLRTGSGDVGSNSAFCARFEDAGCTDDIFFLSYCRPLSDILLDYLYGYIPETVWIGTVMDGHF